MDLNWGAEHLLLLLLEMGGKRELITISPCNILGIFVGMLLLRTLCSLS